MEKTTVIKKAAIKKVAAKVVSVDKKPIETLNENIKPEVAPEQMPETISDVQSEDVSAIKQAEKPEITPVINKASFNTVSDKFLKKKLFKYFKY